MRFALGVDDDLRPFYERFRFDPLIGRSRPRPAAPARVPAPRAVRGARLGDHRAAHRVRARRGDPAAHGPDAGRAAARGPACATCPSARTFAGIAPARLQALDLSAGRALALVRAAREVAAGRVDLRAPDHERGWRRLRAIPGIGRGRSRCSRCTGRAATTSSPPATSAYLKLVGCLQHAATRTRARPRTRCVSSSRPTRAGPAWPARTPSLRGRGRVFVAEPLARAGTRSSAPGRVGGQLDELVVAASSRRRRAQCAGSCQPKGLPAGGKKPAASP